MEDTKEKRKKHNSVKKKQKTNTNESTKCGKSSVYMLVRYIFTSSLYDAFQSHRQIYRTSMMLTQWYLHVVYTSHQCDGDVTQPLTNNK